MRINYFFRKPEVDYFSIEELFNNIINNLPKEISANKYIMPELSRGIKKRITNSKYARQNQGDINHITGDINYISLLTNKKKTILTIHDYVYRHKSRGIRLFLIWLFWYYIPVRRVGYVTTISEFTKREVLEVTKIPESKIKVIHNCVPSHYHAKEKVFNKSKPNILQVGTNFNKNIERIAEAIQGINCSLTILGKLSENQKKALEKCKVEYSNFQNSTHQEVYQKYIEADLVAFVSLYEGFGMPILEANAVGRPIITSNVASMPEVAGNAACLVDPYSVEEIKKGILKIINDDSYRNTLIASGFENTKRFRTEIIVNKYVELYKEVQLENYKI